MHSEPLQPETTGQATREVTWHLRLAYDGGAFHGWQIQPGQRTVQGELQDRLRRLLRAPELKITGSSRTDAGVHALDQRVSFTAATPEDLDPERLRYSLNRWLPPDVRVQDAAIAADGFNARHHNAGKAYTYCLCNGPKPHPLWARFLWALPAPIDLAAAAAAAALLEGEHDFASFGVNPKRELESTVCRLHRVEVIPCGDLVCVSVLGDRFLYRMVRGLVGYLVHVGQHRAAPADVLGVLAARQRSAAAQSAPAEGLFLARVFDHDADRLDYRPRVPPFAWGGLEP
ncbi:MAG: tRNA pseudouridine(38-40) synthase TruA [Lentisphaerae bacterium]|nr:tRNA pseudouridine(38-40) synthase TruA [Lentisphaerota bacterium]